MQTSQCLSYRSLQERMEGLEEMKEGEEEEEEIEGNRRDEEEIQDSLVVEEGMMVKFPLNPLTNCLLPLQLLLQGAFRQEEIKQPH